MSRSAILWIIAIIITLSSVMYQRLTGPTHPMSADATLNGIQIEAVFDRSHGGDNDHTVMIKTGSIELTADLYWKRYKTNDDWSIVNMKRENDKLIADLPGQPAAGKLVYKVIVSDGSNEVQIPEELVIIRFKGEVPLYVLIPHILFMFGALILSMRTGLEIFNKEPKYKTLSVLTVITLFIGGMILGPLVQKFAFDAYWTGFPFGTDLTDNKTLIAFIGWLAALYAVFKLKKPKVWIAIAFVLMIFTYLIPHSVLGSELDYNEMDRQNKLEQLNDN
jgi:hypothetical protein